MTHPTWQLNLEKGALIFTPCPGTKGVALQASLEQLKADGVTTVVTALGNQEMADKQVSELGSLTEELGMQWFQLEIEDDCAPEAGFAAKWRQVSNTLHSRVDAGEKVAMHCMGGSGRTGLLAAHLLLEKGWPLEKIISEVQALRPGAFTKAVQLEYIQGVAGA